MRVPLHGVFLLAAAATSSVPRGARAQPPAPELMARLAQYAERFERIRTHCTYLVRGQYQTLDGDGRPDGVRKLEARVQSDGDDVPQVEVLSYSEDGRDKTDQARAEARERAAKRRGDTGRKTYRIPLLAQEQPRYVFDQVQVDAADATRVRIAFRPKTPANDTIEGSAWIDTRTGAPMSAGFKLSKVPLFVDYVHFTVEFGEKTALGPAVSAVSVDGRTGFLFLRKRFHVAATLSDYRLPAAR